MLIPIFVRAVGAGIEFLQRFDTVASNRHDSGSACALCQHSPAPELLPKPSPLVVMLRITLVSNAGL